MKPRLLDLYCGAGGAARGYQLAGWHVTGVDHRPQPHYAGDQFVQADALTYIAAASEYWVYDAIHASPPCQRYSRYSRNLGTADRHPDSLAATREALRSTGLPYVIENVPGAPMRPDVLLCGSMFDLPTVRHRWFELSVPAAALVPPCNHVDAPIGVYGHGTPQWHRRKLGRNTTRQDWCDALGIDWMSRAELSQAIPPAYTRFIGELLLAHLNHSAPTAATVGALERRSS